MVKLIDCKTMIFGNRIDHRPMLLNSITISCFLGFIGAKKNVLLILSDDGGFEIGAYNHTVCKTPNIDRLARRSLLFKEAFTSVSSCSPSRSALLTGRPQHENGMYGLQHDYHHFSSFESISSVTKLLQENNIKTGLVGKKHVAPSSVYPFEFEHSEFSNSILQVGRNITRIKNLVDKFLKDLNGAPFFLYVAFHDPHRDSSGKYGSFAEKFGNGQEGMGFIPDWKPSLYNPSDVILPYFVQDTPAARLDIAAQYTTISRLDQGIGILLNELEKFGLMEETLVIYSSDNGIPFPMGRTNLYEPGIRVPLLISSPLHRIRWGQESSAIVNLLDIVPTILDWYDLHKTLFKKKVAGSSLMPLLQKEAIDKWNVTYASHSLHEIGMYYPMRAIRTHSFKLIKNLNYKMPFPIDQDFYKSQTFQDLLNRTKQHEPLHWFTDLKSYYYRDKWQLFNLENDGKEVHNLAYDPPHFSLFNKLKKALEEWQEQTDDPWLCNPEGVKLKHTAQVEQCGDLQNYS